MKFYCSFKIGGEPEKIKKTHKSSCSQAAFEETWFCKEKNAKNCHYEGL
jgi:hypothetical protein